MEEKDNGELVLDDVVQISPDELDDSQKTFLQENADNLTDEQKETFKDILEKKEEVIKLGEVEPEIRTPAQKKEEKTEEEEINPDDEQVIKKVVEKRIKPVADILQRVKDEQEVDAFLRVKPELSKYRDVIIKYVQHPAYANIPVYNIVGTGCDMGDQLGDGTILEKNAQLAGAQNFIVKGSCSYDIILHSRMLGPNNYPSVYEFVKKAIKDEV